MVYGILWFGLSWKPTCLYSIELVGALHMQVDTFNGEPDKVLMTIPKPALVHLSHLKASMGLSQFSCLKQCSPCSNHRTSYWKAIQLSGMDPFLIVGATPNTLVEPDSSSAFGIP